MNVNLMSADITQRYNMIYIPILFRRSYTASLIYLHFERILQTDLCIWMLADCPFPYSLAVYHVIQQLQDQFRSGLLLEPACFRLLIEQNYVGYNKH